MKRRTFLKRFAPALALPLTLRGMRLNALAHDPRTIDGLADTGDRVLVVIQMEGGNDGLNTVIPIEDDLYYAARPTIAIGKDAALPLTGTPNLRLHPALQGMQRMFNDGRMAIVQNIGYSDYTLSHFVGTEIWNTASGTAASEIERTGWIGRYLQGEFPDYPRLIPDDPPALQIRPATSSLLAIQNSTIGVALTDPIAFHELVTQAPMVDDDPPPATLASAEWIYLRTIETQAFAFSQSIRRAALAAHNIAAYPEGNSLADSLAIVARLIAGGLRTRVYVVSIGNFDTHGNQLEHQGIMLARLDAALAAFDADTIALGIDQRVVGMTYSEFGRRIVETSSGTDHGAAAPHFVFGRAVDGGRVLGGMPDLAHPDANGNLAHTISFQCYYASVLAPLFNIEESRLHDVLPVGLCEQSERVQLFHSSAIGLPTPRFPADGTPRTQPNPSRVQATILFHLAAGGHTRILLFASDGSLASVLYDAYLDAGDRSIQVDVRSLASGVYRYSIEGTTGRQHGMLVVER